MTVPKNYRGPFCTGPIIEATRAYMKASRAILADLCLELDCDSLNRLSAGPIRRIGEFLAGCRLTFVLIAWDESGRRQSYGGPRADAVRDLVTRLLSAGPSAGLSPSTPANLPAALIAATAPLAEDPAGRVAALRQQWTESGLGALVDELSDRGIQFLLGWQPPTSAVPRLDHSVGADPDKVESWLRWFVDERLPF